MSLYEEPVTHKQSFIDFNIDADEAGEISIKEDKFDAESFKDFSMILQQRPKKDSNPSKRPSVQCTKTDSPYLEKREDSRQPISVASGHLSRTSLNNDYKMSLLSNENAILKTRVSSLDAENEILREEKRQLEANNSEQGSVIHALREKIDKLNHKLTEYKQHNELHGGSLQKKAQQLKAENAELKSSYSRLQNEASSIENRYKKELEKLRTDIGTRVPSEMSHF